MISVDSCVICSGDIHQLRTVPVAPFLTKRVWNVTSTVEVRLMYCRACMFYFYDPRLTPDEEKRLYHNYRTAEYQRTREASNEPYYTREFHEALESEASYEQRRQPLRRILQENLKDRTIHTILDYGGGNGGLVKGLLTGAVPYVYDISGAATVPGVHSIPDPREVQADLTVNSNVLEHLGDPVAHAKEMLTHVRPGSMVLFEVPHEHPGHWMHEHINCFNPLSLYRLVDHLPCKRVAQGVYAIMDGLTHVGSTIWVLAEAQ